MLSARRRLWHEDSNVEHHISADDLEAFVMEQLEGDQADRVLDHVLECEHCALRLVREAALIHAIREALRKYPN